MTCSQPESLFTPSAPALSTPPAPASAAPVYSTPSGANGTAPHAAAPFAQMYDGPPHAADPARAWHADHLRGRGWNDRSRDEGSTQAGLDRMAQIAGVTRDWLGVAGAMGVPGMSDLAQPAANIGGGAAQTVAGVGNLANGHVGDGLHQTVRGLATATNGVAGLLGNSPVGRVAGAVNSLGEVSQGAENLLVNSHTDHGSDPAAERGVYQMLHGTASFGGNVLPGPAGVLSRLAAAGLSTGNLAISVANANAVERGDYGIDNYTGRNASASASAANTGTAVGRDAGNWLWSHTGHNETIADIGGGIVGGATSIGLGIQRGLGSLL